MERLKTSSKPFQFIVSRATPRKRLFDTNIKVSLEEYKINEDAKSNGFDVSVDIALKQYRDWGTKTVIIKQQAAVTATVEDIRPTDNAPTASTHKVVKGDCLWDIAKQYNRNAEIIRALSND